MGDLDGGWNIKKRDRALNFKKNYLFMGILLVAIILLAAITWNSTRIITERTVENHQQSIAVELGKTVELWLKQHMNIIDATGIALQEISIGETRETKRILQVATRAGDFSDVYIGRPDGIIILGSQWIPPAGYDPRIRPWFRKAVLENRTAFTNPYQDLTTMKMVIAIVRPLWIKDVFAGVLSSDIILDTLKKNLLNAKIGTSGYSFIIDDQGTILVHPNGAFEMTTQFQSLNSTLSNVLEHFKKSSTGSWHYNMDGKEMILSHRSLAGSHWYLCTTVEKQEAYTLAKNTAMLFAMEMVFKILGVLALLTLLVICASAAAFLISRRQFDAIVAKHKQLLSGKDKDLKGEISRRKDMETRYHTIFNMATNGILLSRGNVFVECNKKSTELFYMSRRRVLGKTLLDFSPERQQNGQESRLIFKMINQKLCSDRQQNFKWFFQRGDGTQFPAEVSMKLLQLGGDVVTLSSIWDISKRENAEHQLRQAQKMAAMGEMMSSIAHQWRQPLNALSTYVASLIPAFYNGMLNQAFVEKMVSESDAQIQFMSSTINDFKEYFKPSKSKLVFDVNDVVDRAVNLMKLQLRQSWVVLHIHEDDTNKNISVLGYKNEFVHVLVNIISNARHAIKEKQKLLGNEETPGRIDITVSQQGKNQVQIIVMDSGTGIPGHLLEKVFTPYFTTKGTASGTGIGLYMAKMIVENEMQGSITVENHINGAKIKITLPLADTVEQRDIQ
ncbi:PAS domain S-box-containing protein [Desulfocicer vacuolatum DSM 3385]|uniref:histidine kinase n=2 Tax=Desulfocicer vacuolatum TaxID=2298 RepID=A0A1W2D2X1_9BACT|nr:PAS domain S-box-containing protein [Desulfocicer vacuolatum DSM 3385]